MSRIFMSHSVADYDTWRAIYDDDAPRRAEAGITEAGHFHSPADRNQFLIVWDMDAPWTRRKRRLKGCCRTLILAPACRKQACLVRPRFGSRSSRDRRLGAWPRAALGR